MKTNVKKAIEILNKGEYTCVLCGEDTVYTSMERGVKPLLDWLDDHKEFKGFCAADKVVGKAAAFLYVLLGVETVYAPVMSRGAIDILERYDIRFFYDCSADKIINRAGTGICPMEETVWDISNPEEALKAIKIKLTDLLNSNIINKNTMER